MELRINEDTLQMVEEKRSHRNPKLIRENGWIT